MPLLLLIALALPPDCPNYFVNSRQETVCLDWSKGGMLAQAQPEKPAEDWVEYAKSLNGREIYEYDRSAVTEKCDRSCRIRNRTKRILGNGKTFINSPFPRSISCGSATVDQKSVQIGSRSAALLQAVCQDLRDLSSSQSPGQ